MPDRKSSSHAGRGLTAFLLSAPALLGLLLFVLLPFLLAAALSLTNLRLGSPLPLEWMGLEQYRRILHDPTFRHALLNNLLFVVTVVPVQTVLALALAVLLNQRLGAIAWFRVLFFMPVVFPLSLVAVIWVLIFAPGPDGPMNALLELISFGAWTPRDFLHDEQLALSAIMLTSIWQGTGFQMVVILAGLQAISAELNEAATIDGAGCWQRFWFVTLPQLRNTLIFVVLVTTILAFRLFDQVQIMTQGGPHDATTTVMFEAVQTAFSRQQIGRGAAMTVVMFLVVLLLSLLQRRIARQQREVS